MISSISTIILDYQFPGISFFPNTVEYSFTTFGCKYSTSLYPHDIPQRVFLIYVFILMYKSLIICVLSVSNI